MAAPVPCGFLLYPAIAAIVGEDVSPLTPSVPVLTALTPGPDVLIPSTPGPLLLMPSTPGPLSAIPGTGRRYSSRGEACSRTRSQFSCEYLSPALSAAYDQGCCRLAAPGAEARD